MKEPGHIAQHSVELLHCDPQEVLDKEKRFPGAAALVVELKHYYDHLMQGVSSTGPVAKAVVGRQHVDYSHFPEGLGREVRSQLTHLQDSALLLEANGKEERAQEVLDVAAVISTMYKTIKQMTQPEVAAVPNRRG